MMFIWNKFLMINISTYLDLNPTTFQIGKNLRKFLAHQDLNTTTFQIEKKRKIFVSYQGLNPDLPIQRPLSHPLHHRISLCITLFKSTTQHGMYVFSMSEGQTSVAFRFFIPLKHFPHFYPMNETDMLLYRFLCYHGLVLPYQHRDTEDFLTVQGFW